MTPATFANEMLQYAEYVANKKGGLVLSYEELEELRKTAYHAFASAEMRLGRAKIDGLDAVSWIRKYREEFGCSLREAKDAWDVRVAKAKERA